ncbi:uncharacterized protein [Rutidosis leptorrhynchoides]|uniref:uncharacterized protein n=1 Tax=Rutidosis leptorrhynchoides TaxID=125765 RepID=UPI003A99C08C
MTTRSYQPLHNPVSPNLNGALHCIGYDADTERCVILGFDVNNEVFRPMKLPNGLGKKVSRYKLLLFQKSLIALCCFDSPLVFSFEIWVMKQYGSVESWTKMWKCNSPGFERGDVLGFRDNGEILCCAYNNSRRIIISFDPNTREEKELLDAPFTLFDGIRYCESLVLLDNGNAVSYIT